MIIRLFLRTPNRHWNKLSMAVIKINEQRTGLANIKIQNVSWAYFALSEQTLKSVIGQKTSEKSSLSEWTTGLGLNESQDHHQLGWRERESVEETFLSRERTWYHRPRKLQWVLKWALEPVTNTTNATPPPTTKSPARFDWSNEIAFYHRVQEQTEEILLVEIYRKPDVIFLVP